MNIKKLSQLTFFSIDPFHSSHITCHS